MSILQQLGLLLLDSIPTILIFVLLHFYLKRVLYRPLRQVLQARAERIGGRLEAARATTETAEAKLANYEAALRQQRLENYRRMENRRQAALQAGQENLNAVRRETAQSMAETRQQLAAETARARTQLQTTVDGLAEQILAQVMSSRPGRAAQPGVGA